MTVVYFCSRNFRTNCYLALFKVLPLICFKMNGFITSKLYVVLSDSLEQKSYFNHSPAYLLMNADNTYVFYYI